MKTSKKASADYGHPETVEEHFQAIMTDKALINSEHTKVTPKDIPEWFDEELFIQGQNYYKRNILGINLGYLVGLVAIFLIPTVLNILIFTKQSSTSCTAFKRYFQTLLHIYNLHMHDIKDPHSKFYKSLNTIRWKHSTNSDRSLRSEYGGITQKDMVLTQFSFIAYILLRPDLMALTDEPMERQGINHFWRVIGCLLGIPDRLNLCRKDEYETKILCQKLLDEVFTKALEKPPPAFEHTTSVTIDGLRNVDPFADLDAFLVFFYEINGCKYEKKLGLYSQIKLMYRKSLVYIIATPIIGPIVRTFWNYYFRSTYWIFERAPIFAWLRYGKQESKIKLYPHSTF